MGNKCILWHKAIAKKGGYGVTSKSGKTLYAHRVEWEKHCGPIPSGLVVMHKCDVPACVNIEHLVLGTLADNNRDRAAKGRDFNGSKTHCAKGHPYSGSNLSELLLLQTKKGKECLYISRRCRICKNANQRAYTARKRGDHGETKEQATG